MESNLKLRRALRETAEDSKSQDLLKSVTISSSFSFIFMECQRVISEAIRDGQLFNNDAHHYANVALTAYSLGIGQGIAFASILTLFISLPCSLSIYIGFLSLFHLLEYVCIAVYETQRQEQGIQHDRLSMSSFVLNHSFAYYLAHFMALIEFLVYRFIWTPIWLRSSLGVGSCLLVGMSLVLLGQCIRSLAMLTAQHNFTHQVADTPHRQTGHFLIQHGIYALMRHPSYTGFWIWSMGMQLLLGNFFSLMMHCVMSYRFFSSRIAYEEAQLMVYFGDAYKRYRERVWSGMPWR